MAAPEALAFWSALYGVERQGKKLDDAGRLALRREKFANDYAAQRYLSHLGGDLPTPRGCPPDLAEAVDVGLLAD